MGIFAFRFLLLKNDQIENPNSYTLLGGPLNPFLNLLGNLCIWFEITAALMVFMRPFAHFRTAKFYVKCIATPILIVCALCLQPMIYMIQGHNSWSLTTIFLPIEIAGLLSVCIYYWFKDYKEKLHKHSYAEVAVFASLINLATIPPFLVYSLFGYGNKLVHVYNFSVPHRIYLYALLIVVPLALYFALRNAHKDKIHYSLVFISLGTALNFFSYYPLDDFFKFFNSYGNQVSLNNLFFYLGRGGKITGFEFAIWNFPLHLCNSAMYVLPICFIFRKKKLFYFTYFINVFGALLAALMPNVGESLPITHPDVIQFWVNHSIAFFLPLLGVALHEFERPKLKQYFYSAGFFAIYFVIVFILNTIFTAFGHSTDFFFINSDFIAKKLGAWAQSIFKISFTFNIGGVSFVIRPVYQFLYFVFYFLLGFGVWFIYQIGFDISDSHYDLKLRLIGIKQDEIALKSLLHGRSLDEPMEKDVGIAFKLEHFSKKYSYNTYYAVEDANLDVHGGEIFGFLGPNGAGKSTIIKSTVGIQPISEGKINICGFDVQSQPVQAKSLIGFVPDHYALYEKLSGREYLNYIADIYEVSKEDRDARLHKYIKLFELESSIDNKIKTYSHGMKQKITIMAALIHNPKVWILDEPLTGLDPTSIFQVKECMRQHAAEGNIVFFSSHIIDIVEKLCDRIAIIKKGHIQCVKTVKEIEDSGTSLEEFYLETIGDLDTLRKESELNETKK